ncbi:hypothetical protein JTB14_020690 [Gonioctena quinquepunctata]|nr:hypothetical protein JTB14_020690 [Gonioctena quinquepunctata]
MQAIQTAQFKTAQLNELITSHMSLTPLQITHIQITTKHSQLSPTRSVLGPRSLQRLTLRGLESVNLAGHLPDVVACQGTWVEDKGAAHPLHFSEFGMKGGSRR